jgi:hypothetical protein
MKVLTFLSARKMWQLLQKNHLFSVHYSSDNLKNQKAEAPFSESENINICSTIPMHTGLILKTKREVMVVSISV